MKKLFITFLLGVFLLMSCDYSIEVSGIVTNKEFRKERTVNQYSPVIHQFIQRTYSEQYLIQFDSSRWVNVSKKTWEQITIGDTIRLCLSSKTEKK